MKKRSNIWVYSFGMAALFTAVPIISKGCGFFAARAQVGADRLPLNEYYTSEWLGNILAQNLLVFGVLVIVFFVIRLVSVGIEKAKLKKTEDA